VEITKLILEYFKVLVSWPVVVLTIAIYFFSRFKEGISDFLQRVEEGEGYGIKVKATTPSEQRKEASEIKPAPGLDEAEKFVAEHPKEAVLEYRKILNGYRWEKAFNIIYGTQLHLLEHLGQKGSSGEKYVNLLPFYNEFVKRSKLSTTQFADYLGFLRDSQFIMIEGTENDLVVKIAPYGVDFLSYVKGQYPYYSGKAF